MCQCLIGSSVRKWAFTANYAANWPAIHNNLGYTLGDMDKFYEAIEQFKQALLIDPAYMSARINLNKFLAEKQKLNSVKKTKN